MLISFLLRNAAALLTQVENIKKELNSQVKPEFTKFREISLEKLLTNAAYSASKALRSQVNQPLFFDYIQDAFSDNHMARELGARLIDVAVQRGIPEDEADGFVGPRKKFTELQKKEHKSLIERMRGYSLSFLRRSISHLTDNFIKEQREKDPEDVIEEGVLEPAVGPQHEIDEELEKYEEWKEGIIPATEKQIEKEKKDPKVQSIYKTVLLERVIKNRTQKSVADDLEITQQMVDKIESDIKDIAKRALQKLEKEKGFGRGETVKETISVPKYTTVLSDPKNSKDFKEIMKYPERKRGPESDTRKKIMDMLAEGKALEDIAKELGVSSQFVGKVNNTNFKPQYEDWYRKRETRMKRALYRIARALLAFEKDNNIEFALPYRLAAKVEQRKKVIEDLERAIENEESKKDPDEDKLKKLREKLTKMRGPGKKTKKDPRGELRKKLEEKLTKEKDPEKVKKLKKDIELLKGPPSAEDPVELEAAHKLMVQQALKDKSPAAEITFSSDYDYMDLLRAQERAQKEGKKDHGLGDPNFKWLKYSVVLNTKRKFGKKVHDLTYRYEQDLSNDGELVGRGDSYMAVDGKRVLDDDEGKELLDEYVKNKMLPEGVIPHEDIRVRYINTKKAETKASPILSIEGLIKKYGPPILHIDPKHKERVEKVQRIRRKREIGPELKISERDAERQRQLIRRDIRQEKKDQNRERVVEKLEKSLRVIEDYLKKIDEHRVTPEDAEEAFDEIKDYKRMKKERKSYVYLKPDETYKYVKLGKLEGPQSEKMKKLVEIFEKYGLTAKPNPKTWLEPDDVRTLAKALAGIIQNKAESDLKDFQNPTKNKIEALQKRLDQAREKDMSGPSVTMLSKKVNRMKSLKDLKPEERKRQVEKIVKEYGQDLDEAKRLIESIPKDLKARRDKMKKEDPEGYAALAKRKSMDWVDDPEKVDKIIAQSIVDMSKKFERPIEKQAPMKGIAEDHFKVIQHHLVELKEGFGTLANKLKKAPIAAAKGEEMISSRKNQIEKIKDSITQAQKELKEKTERIPQLSEAENKEIEKEEAERNKELRLIQDTISTLSTLIERAGPEEKIQDLMDKTMKKTRGLLEMTQDSLEKLKKKEPQKSKKPIYIKPLEKKQVIESPTRKYEEKIKHQERVIDALLRQLNVLEGLAEEPESFPETGGKLTESLKKEISELKGVHDDLMKGMNELRKDPEVPPDMSKQIKSLSDKIRGLGNELQESVRKLKLEKAVPAVAAAQVLLRHTDYFSEMYSRFMRWVFFRDKYLAVEPKQAMDYDSIMAAEAPSKRDILTARQEVVRQARAVAERNLRSQAILKDLRKLKSKTEEFIDMFPSGAKEPHFTHPTVQKGAPAGVGGPKTGPEESPKYTTKPETSFKLKKAAEKKFKSLEEMGEALLGPEDAEGAKKLKEEERKKFEKAIHESVPRGLLNKAYNLAMQVNEKDKGLGQKAYDELETMVERFTKTFGFSKEKVENLAHVKNTTPGKILISLRMTLGRLIRQALDTYINEWMDVKEQLYTTTKERPGAERHEEMRAFLEHMIPELKKMPAGKVKVVKPTIPTPKEIVDTIVNTFEKEPGKSFEKEISNWGLGGGAAAKSKSKREKIPKYIPPALPKARTKEMVIRFLKKGGKGGEDLVDHFLSTMVPLARKRVKEAVDKGHTVDAHDIIDAFVSGLKSLFYEIKALNVQEPRWMGGQLPKPGTTRPPSGGGKPPFVGTPDIPLDSQEDAEDLLDEIKVAYKAINEYIAPDTIGIPPEAPARTRKVKTYLPYGLAMWLEKTPKEEPPAEKKAVEVYDYPTEMAYNVALKFSSLQIRGVDERTEQDLATI